MQTNRKKRLAWILFLLTGISIAVSLMLYALRQNISLYYTPTQIEQDHITPKQRVRLGGLVVKNSIKHFPHTLKVDFYLKDSHQKIKVIYDGILPSLFRVGQGVVVQGHLKANNLFYADQVLAKHDASYHPPGVA